MRKQTKKKRCSCKLCKPHKMGCANRWKDREQAQLKQVEKLKQLYRRMPETRQA